MLYTFAAIRPTSSQSTWTLGYFYFFACAITLAPPLPPNSNNSYTSQCKSASLNTVSSNWTQSHFKTVYLSIPISFLPPCFKKRNLIPYRRVISPWGSPCWTFFYLFYLYQKCPTNRITLCGWLGWVGARSTVRHTWPCRVIFFKFLALWGVCHRGRTTLELVWELLRQCWRFKVENIHKIGTVGKIGKSGRPWFDHFGS